VEVLLLFLIEQVFCGLRRSLEQFVTSPSSCSILSWQEGVDGGHRTRCGYSTWFEPEPYLQLYPSSITCRLHESIFPLRNRNPPPHPPLFSPNETTPHPGAHQDKQMPPPRPCITTILLPNPCPAQPITPSITIPPNFIPTATTPTSNLLHLRRKPRPEEFKREKIW